MPFLIETWDKPNSSAVRQANRPAHLEFLDHNKHLLLSCGAKLNDDGSDAGGGVYLVAVDSRQEAEHFIAADPFTTAELFERVSITRWRKAYVDGRCYL
jgi:uncharacterized protein